MISQLGLIVRYKDSIYVLGTLIECSNLERKIRKPNKTFDLRMKMEMNGKFPLTRTLSLISVCEVCLKAIKIAESSDCQDRKVNNPVTSSVYLRVETIAELENATAKDNERKSTAHFWIY